MINSNKSNNKEPDTEPFNVMHFCTRLFSSSKNIEYSPKELHELVNRVTECFKKDPTLAKLSPPCTIVGDIHGQFRDLLRILNCRSSKSKEGCDIPALEQSKYMFLGDFVDRGPQSIECICMMFSLKVLYPSKYMLLRGNHETKSINFAYGFRDELMSKFGADEGDALWQHFNEAFSWMPIAGLVGDKILCMHGGISSWLTSLNDIKAIPRPLVDVNENKLALDLLWSDPMNEGNMTAINGKALYLKNTTRGLSCTFNQQAVVDCMTRLKIDLIVRAHQVQDNGFKFSADRKLVTIFSAPRYMNADDNKGAILKVYPNGQISIVTLKAKKPVDKVGKIDNGEPTKITSLMEKKDQKTSSQSSTKNPNV